MRHERWALHADALTSALSFWPQIRIFRNISDPRPNPTNQKAENLDPIQPRQTQPNPWVDQPMDNSVSNEPKINSVPCP